MGALPAHEASTDDMRAATADFPMLTNTAIDKFPNAPDDTNGRMPTSLPDALRKARGQGIHQRWVVDAHLRERPESVLHILHIEILAGRAVAAVRFFNDIRSNTLSRSRTHISHTTAM